LGCLMYQIACSTVLALLIVIERFPHKALLVSPAWAG
jgi:hypothetical protein